jgi:hypothetical protein
VAQGAQPVRTSADPNWVRVLAVVVLALATAVTVWLIVKGDDEHRSRGTAPGSAATIETLRSLPGQLGHAVYWAGAQGASKYELTQVDGNIFIRYLPTGIGVGDPRPDYLTIGTYPTAHAYRVLARQGKQRGNSSRRVAGGGIAVWSEDRPQSVYLAYPRSDLQIVVYDPSAARARRLVTSGAVKPIR